MRVAGVVLAILLIAACPPRRARVVYVQPCPTPYVVVPAQPAPPPVTAAKPVDPGVEAILTDWEKRVAELSNVRTEILLKRTDAAFKKETNYKGVVLWMKPNYAVMRLDNTDDATKADYEAYICDGKSVYVYNGLTKTITEIKLPPEGLFHWLSASNNSMFALLTEPKAKEITERFDVTIFKSDEHYVYLDIKPLRADDRKEFQHLRIALYNAKLEKYAFLPAQVYVLRPNGDSEAWKFINPQVDIPGVAPANFAFVPVKGWSGGKLPPPPPLPGKP
jgi:TIGR03009 family protein